MHKFIILLVVLALVGCATTQQQTLPSYDQIPAPKGTAEIVQYGDERWVHVLGTDYEFPLLGVWMRADVKKFRKHFLVLEITELDDTKMNIIVYNPLISNISINVLLRSNLESKEKHIKQLCKHHSNTSEPFNYRFLNEYTSMLLCNELNYDALYAQYFIQIEDDVEIHVVLSAHGENIVTGAQPLQAMLKKIRLTPSAKNTFD